MATGNAVKGSATRPPAKYPRQLIVMVSDELADRLEAEAADAGVSKSEVSRYYLEAGLDARQGGYR